MAYIFNSIIGRLYFKYSAKGKNQTMVKISKDELNGFYLPIPSLEQQDEIIKKVKTELEKQEVINQQILDERNKIDKIIEDCIKTNT
jgi:type I restriction enzyme S subunit